MQQLAASAGTRRRGCACAAPPTATRRRRARRRRRPELRSAGQPAITSSRDAAGGRLSDSPPRTPTRTCARARRAQRSQPSSTGTARAHHCVAATPPRKSGDRLAALLDRCTDLRPDGRHPALDRVELRAGEHDRDPSPTVATTDAVRRSPSEQSPSRRRTRPVRAPQRPCRRS